MKTLIIVAGLAAVVGLAALNQIFGGEIVVVNERVATTTVEVQVVEEKLEVRIKDAQEAARAEVEAKAQNAYNAVIEEEMTAIADDVKKEYIKEIEATISSESY